MVPLFLLFSLSLAAIVTPAGRGGRGRGGRGRGGRGGRGQGGGGGVGNGGGRLQGRVWNRDGEHAKYILRNYLAGHPNFQSWNDFKDTHANWMLSASNPTGYYLQHNMRRNFNAVIDRYEHHIDPDMDYDGELRPHVFVLSFLLTRSLPVAFIPSCISTGLS